MLISSHGVLTISPKAEDAGMQLCRCLNLEGKDWRCRLQLKGTTKYTERGKVTMGFDLPEASGTTQ
jgi:hypothetical protein